MNKIKLNEEIHLENVGGYYYKPFNNNGEEIKGILLKDCVGLYSDGSDTWEMITIESDGSLDVGPFHWDGEDLTQIGYNNFVLNLIIKLNKNK
jgi:hypothetical protein